ncbi:hypothetical protein [Microvirga antarctica]|uniref:hypothetical protein n=1 Tax=Microvirga antarctica TaxID=2819233 RepID=UPI001B303D98|nr:hypothetical protein [Microvirga antarctica]
MKLTSLKIDTEKLETGAWVDTIPEMGELRLHVRGLNNADYRRHQAKLLEAVPRAKRVGGRIDPDEQDRIVSLCLLNTVLLDWDGLTDDDDKALPYSRDMAQTLLVDPAYRRFRDAVIWAAGVVAEDGDLALQDAVGNSSPASAGTSNGAASQGTTSA